MNKVLLAVDEEKNPKMQSSISVEYTLKEKCIRRTVRAGRYSGVKEYVSSELLASDSSKPIFAAAFDRLTLQGQPSKVSPVGVQKTVRVIDLFCGCGGFSVGIREAIEAVGATPEFVLASDKNEESLAVYEENFPGVSTHHANLNHVADFQALTRKGTARFLAPPEIIDSKFKQLRGNVDIVIAGPPCQGHSNFNNATRRNDPRNLLYLTPVAIGVALDAPVIVIENVPEVTKDKGNVVGLAVSLLESAQYQVSERIVDGRKVGLAQTRRRHILIAAKSAKPDLDKAIEACSNGSRDLEWAIGDLRNVSTRKSIDVPSELSEENKKRIDFLFDNDIYDLPDKERPECHQNGTTYRSVYGRLNWSDPAGTITTGFLSPGRGRYTHPEFRRALTPHEAARIQSFPDTYRFFQKGQEVTSKKHLSQWIGDAVPPRIGFVAGLAALAAHSGDGR